MVSKKYRKVLGDTKEWAFWDVGKGSRGRGSHEKELKGSFRKPSPITLDSGGRFGGRLWLLQRFRGL